MTMTDTSTQSIDFGSGSSRALFADYLNSLGLGSLADAAWAQWKNLQGSPDAAGEFAVWVRGTPQYQARFPYAADLRAKGVPFTEAGAITYEQNARALLHSVGVPDGFVTQDYLNKLIGGNISFNELEQRVASNISEYELAPDVVKQEFRNQLGDDKALLAYFLDPEHTAQQFQTIKANALVRGYSKQFGIKVGDGAAQYALGQSGAQVQQELAQAAQFGGLTRGTVGGSDAVTADQFGKFAFTGDTTAVKKAIEQRAAEFSDAGGPASGQNPGFGKATGA